MSPSGGSSRHHNSSSTRACGPLFHLTLQDVRYAAADGARVDVGSARAPSPRPGPRSHRQRQGPAQHVRCCARRHPDQPGCACGDESALTPAEDMFATLGSFAIAPLWSLRRMGFKLTDREQLAFIAVWRHIGSVVVAVRGLTAQLLYRRRRGSAAAVLRPQCVDGGQVVRLVRFPPL